VSSTFIHPEVFNARFTTQADLYSLLEFYVCSASMPPQKSKSKHSQVEKTWNPGALLRPGAFFIDHPSLGIMVGSCSPE
jgi:hypothetical protein